MQFELAIAVGRDLGAVRRDNHRATGLPNELIQELQNRCCSFVVEVSGRFVREQQ